LKGTKTRAYFVPPSVTTTTSFKILTPGFIALHDACLAGVFEYVVALVKAGSNVNARNKDGVTPLMDACSAGKPEIIQYLLKEGLASSEEFNIVRNGASGNLTEGEGSVQSTPSLLTWLV